MSQDAEAARAAHASDILQRRTLFVRSLDYSITSAQLSEKFSFIAPIKHATVVINPSNGSSRGFGFVTFADAEDAQRAIKELHDTEFEGRKVKVELAEPRHRSSTNTTTTVAEEKEKKPIPILPIPGKPQKLEPGEKRRSPRLIIRNLAWSVQKPEQLVKVFQSFGKVKDVIIPKKRNGEMAGFAFVTMKGYKNAERAMGKVNGTEIEGRVVAVDWAVEKVVWESVVAQREEARKVQEALEEEEEEEEDGEEGDEDDEMDEDEDMDDEEDEDEDEEDRPATDSTTTLFIRNLPYSATDDSLFQHFSQFGPVHYARVVIDPSTARPKGTGFVCFYDPEITTTCLRNAPKSTGTATKSDKPSLLQSEALDPSGTYTLDGRILSLSRAVDRSQAEKLSTISSNAREKQANDKRRLYLLNEGMIPANSPTWAKIPPSERLLRDQSREQRRKLLKADPNLHLSLTRLSIRNLPRWVTHKDLKQIARKAIPGFAEDLKAGVRAPLSREELARDGGEGKAAEEARRAKGVGVVKQAKVQLEKVGGRSRGYGFVEYWSHRYALMGLRYMNGQMIPGSPPQEEEEGATQPRRPTGEGEKKKRLIVEFAIENAKVDLGRKLSTKDFKGGKKRKRDANDDDDDDDDDDEGGKKAKRGNWNQKSEKKKEKKEDTRPVIAPAIRTQEIIRKKRMARRAKKGRK
ncbi:hypothetical protein K440DRAFT_250806 [Wilcoxina mikolae CBS 423.85]|nr:hypothetical protein K440DRAFT_250806 [Wilcoxina mikolae CBS 423.85]